MKKLLYRAPDEYLHLDDDAPESSATDNDVVSFVTAVELYKDVDGNVAARIDDLPLEEQRRIQLAWKRRFDPLPLEEDIVQA